MLRLTALAVCLIFFAGRGNADDTSSPTSLSLSQAVDISLRTNGSFLETREKENQTDQLVPAARSALFPNISLQGSIDRQKDASNGVAIRNNGNSYDLYSASARLTQLLFQIGSLSAIDSVKKNRDIAGYNTDIARRDLIKSIIQGYYLVTLNSRNIQTLKEQKKIVTESLQVAERRERIGRGQLLDVLQAKTQLALLEGQISTAIDQLEEARTVLASLLGNSESQQFSISDNLKAPSIDEVESTIDREKMRIPEVLKDEVLLDQIADQKRTLWGQNLPYLELLGSYAFTNTKESELFTQPANSWMIGLQLTIPLFSGLSTVYQSRALNSQMLQAQLDKRYQEDQANLQRINNKKNLETARDSIETGESALKLAKDSLKEAKRNYGLATIDYLQYLSVQQQYVQAEQSLNTYKYNYIVALGNYYAATGQEMNRLVTLLEKTQR